MPVWRWPSRDRTAWRKACEPCDPFNPQIGRASVWKQSTRANYQLGYGRWLAWWERNGDLDHHARPGERATQERLRAFLASLRADGLAPYTQAGHLMGLSRVLSAMDPTGDYGWITTASLRLHVQARPVTDVTERLRDVREVFKLGLDMMWEAQNGRFRSSHQNATLFRDGLIMAFVVLRPLRNANFSAIRIGEHLRRRGEAWWLSFPEGEMKAGRPFECPFPDELSDALEHYIEVHRRTLLEGKGKESENSGALWISRGSRGHLSSADIRVRIQKATKEEFGRAINPHDFRHLLATTVATDNPVGVTDTPTMLGHVDLESSEEYYNKAKQADAAMRYQETTVAAIRGRGRRSPARAYPKLRLSSEGLNQGNLSFDDQ